MFSLPDYFYDINIFSVCIRIVLAVIIGGVIGLERGANRHPAGFRTHILVCVGAALAMMTNQYICEFFDGPSDPARLGAQVITGVGFLGVGTILVTGRQKIKGLTTAAGLWASACLGLAIGIGFYEGALAAAVVIFLSLAFLPKIETYFYNNSRIMDLYIEIDSITNYKGFITTLRQMDIVILETHLSGSNPVSDKGIAFHLSMKLPKMMDRKKIIDTLSNLIGVYLIDEV